MNKRKRMNKICTREKDCGGSRDVPVSGNSFLFGSVQFWFSLVFGSFPFASVRFGLV